MELNNPNGYADVEIQVFDILLDRLTNGQWTVLKVTCNQRKTCGYGGPMKEWQITAVRDEVDNIPQLLSEIAGEVYAHHMKHGSEEFELRIRTTDVEIL